MPPASLVERIRVAVAVSLTVHGPLAGRQSRGLRHLYFRGAPHYSVRTREAMRVGPGVPGRETITGTAPNLPTIGAPNLHPSRGPG